MGGGRGGQWEAMDEEEDCQKRIGGQLMVEDEDFRRRMIEGGRGGLLEVKEKWRS